MMLQPNDVINILALIEHFSKTNNIQVFINQFRSLFMKHYFMIVALIAIILTIGIPNPIYAQKSTIKHADDFDSNTVQVFNQLFEQCPSGIVLYKLNGEMVIVCLIDANNKLIINDINVHVENNDNDDNDDGKDNDKKDDGPDISCLFNVFQQKCLPDEDGNCPDGFNMNEDGRCFPDHHDEGCPDGYHGVDDDETGQCYSDDEGCPDGMELQDGNCVNKPTEEEEDNTPLPPVTPITTTPLEEVTQSDSTVPEETETENTETTTEDNTNSLSTDTESTEEVEDNTEESEEEEDNNSSEESNN